MKQIEVNQLDRSVVDIIGQQWLLISAGDSAQFNTMTASWGMIGYMFNKNVAMIVVRPTRYTREFLDRCDRFTLTVLADGYRDDLVTLGRISGRDGDKVAQTKLTPCFTPAGNPTFEQAHITLECRKLFVQPMEDTSFIDRGLVEQWYDEAHGEFHIIYIGEIESCWVAE